MKTFFAQAMSLDTGPWNRLSCLSCLTTTTFILVEDFRTSNSVHDPLNFVKLPSSTPHLNINFTSSIKIALFLSRARGPIHCIDYKAPNSNP